MHEVTQIQPTSLRYNFNKTAGQNPVPLSCGGRRTRLTCSNSLFRGADLGQDLIRPNIDIDGEGWEQSQTRRIAALLLLGVALVAVALGLGVASDDEGPVAPARTTPANMTRP